MLTLGNKIRKIRELRNLKQDHMADILGISQSAYSKIEKDEIEVSHERLEQIAKAFGISVQDILSFDERMFFSVMHNQNSSVGYVVHNSIQLSEVEKQHFEDKIKLYEDKIKLLEDKIEYQQKEIERLKSGK